MIITGAACAAAILACAFARRMAAERDAWRSSYKALEADLRQSPTARQSLRIARRDGCVEVAARRVCFAAGPRPIFADETVKHFPIGDDPAYAQMLAEELVEKLQERD